MQEAALSYSLGLLIASLVWWRWRQQRCCSEAAAGPPPPWAPGTRLPLLGHALAYKRDPPGFLRRARAAVGPVFKINLAGLVTTIVSDGDLSTDPPP